MGICQSTTASQTKSNPVPNTVQIPLGAGAKNNIIKEMAVKNGKGEVINIGISMDVSNKILKSICKITVKKSNVVGFATGFFMKISEDKKYLITNNHVISQENINWDIEIEIYNHETMKLNPNNRDIKYFPGVKDITMVEIKKNDSIYNNIEFLNYDLNYKRGYEIYEDAIIITIQHPFGENAEVSSGRIVKVNENEFDHNITTHD